MEIGASVLFTCILELLAGLGLFLFGMETMSEGLERVAGKQLKGLLGAVTKNRATQVVLGFIITVLMQSSSATTVMLVGFVNAGIMQLSQAVGIIMGANIGTTVTVLMMSVKLDFDVIFCFVGCIVLFLMMFAPKKFGKLEGVVPIIFGVGALFIGVGAGLGVRAGGATCGDDALAMALSRLTKIDIQWIYLITDGLVLGLSITYIPLAKIGWSLLTVVLSGQIIGWMQKLPLRRQNAPPETK